MANEGPVLFTLSEDDIAAMRSDLDRLLMTHHGRRRAVKELYAQILAAEYLMSLHKRGKLHTPAPPQRDRAASAPAGSATTR